MRRLVPALFLLCAFSGGSCGGCAHMGGFGSGLGHASSGWAHVPSGAGHVSFPSNAPSGGVAFHGSPSAAMASPNASPTEALSSAPPLATVRFGGGFHVAHAAAAGIAGLEAPLEMGVEALSDVAAASAADADGDAPLALPSPDGLCRSFADCGDGALGQGALCDRAFIEGTDQTVGICRDACRDDRDCPSPLQCHLGLDPTDRTWGGCVP